MFVSFFPKPKLFFTSAVVWSLLLGLVWFSGGAEFGANFGLPQLAPNAPPTIGVAVFWSSPFLWFTLYYAFGVLAFYAFWRLYSPHPWLEWSVLVGGLILFLVYFSVQVSVAVNNWYGPFYDYVQGLASKTIKSTNAEFYSNLGGFVWIVLVGMNVSVINSFIVSHWVFRWRTAMNDYFMSNWKQLRHIEGASQRIQEDTMRFAQIMEDLGTSMVQSIMSLIAFFPVMVALEKNITELPILGKVDHPLVVAAALWCVIGTGAVMLAGIKLPGLQFRNQRVEAAYRKELVFGEDHEDRADPVTTSELFRNVRKNYFRLYAHYVYFNMVRQTYLQADNIVANSVAGPSLVAGTITFGLLNQISYSFGKVTGSFQYLVMSWSTIVELLSVHKRLRAFEATLDGEALPEIDQKYLRRKAEGAEEAEIAT